MHKDGIIAHVLDIWELFMYAAVYRSEMSQSCEQVRVTSPLKRNSPNFG